MAKKYTQFVTDEDTIDLFADAIDKEVTSQSAFYGNNSTFSGAGDWEKSTGLPNFDVNTTYAGKLYLPTTTVEQFIKITGKLTIGVEYYVSLKIKVVSGTGCKMRIGKRGVVEVPTSSLEFTPTTEEVTYTGKFTCNSVDLFVGVLLADANNTAFTIDDFYVVELGMFDDENMTSLNSLALGDYSNRAFTGNNSTFSGVGDWEKSTGFPNFDVNDTYAGKLYFPTVSSGDQLIKISDVLEVGVKYFITLKSTLVSGAGCTIRVGNRDVEANPPTRINITPTVAEQTFIGEFTAAYTSLYVAILSADANSSAFTFDDFYVVKLGEAAQSHEDRIQVLEEFTVSNAPLIENTETFLTSISKYDKPLTKICVVGDSIMANTLGGLIDPVDDEGFKQRPYRMGYNNIARRVYDAIKFNPATYRRIDHADITKVGTWATLMDTSIMEPAYTANEAFNVSTNSGAYFEMTVPDGQENFSFIAQKRADAGNLIVTLNGGDISAYGSSTVVLSRANDAAGDIGNSFHTEQYLGLPAGANVIRIAKEADTTEVRIWGIFYWSGNTITVQNIAHGGHSLANLKTNHLNAEMIENNFDAILFEAPIINDIGTGVSLISYEAQLKEVLTDYVGNKDVAFITCPPYGWDLISHNYYTDYSDPDLEDFSTTVRNVMHSLGIPNIDVLGIFKKKIENRGGTLEGGEGGTYYLEDGYHPSEAGMLEYFNILNILLTGKPINV